jgi:hypothetical protein
VGVPSRRTAAELLVAYLAVVGVIVLWPTSEVASESVSWLWSGARRLGAPAAVTPTVVEFATNVLLFVPLGFLGSWLIGQWRWPMWLLVGYLASSAIELAQLFFLPARSTALVDVAANTLGAVLGYTLACGARRGLRRRRARRPAPPGAEGLS